MRARGRQQRDLKAITYYKAPLSPAGMRAAVSERKWHQREETIWNLQLVPDALRSCKTQSTLNASVGASFILSMFSIAIKVWAW